MQNRKALWTVWQKASLYHRLPSEVLDPEHNLDSLTRYQVDNAVTFFGVTIENALAERTEYKVNNVTHSQPRYTLTQLLTDGFRLPMPVEKAAKSALQSFAEQLKGYAGRANSGIRVWKYNGPQAKEQ